MALEQGQLSDIKDKLSSAYEDALDPSQRNRLAKAFPAAAEDGYESASEKKDERAALIKAAKGGDVGGAYERFYGQNPDIRSTLSDAASSVFDETTRQAISQASSESGVTEAYKHCSRGNFGKAAEAIGLSSGAINAQSANECRQQVQDKSGFAEQLFNAYLDDGQNDVYVPPE